MKKGAQPSDRVTRFLDAAGIMKREKRNNPEKAIPRKERKAKEEEATKAKEAGDAAPRPPRLPRPPPRRPLPKRPRPTPRLRRSRPKLRRRADARRFSRDRPHPRCPHRRRARRSRRSEAVVVHAGSAGGRRATARWKPRTARGVSKSKHAAGQGSSGRAHRRHRRPRRGGETCATSICSCRATGCRRSRRPTRSITPT